MPCDYENGAWILVWNIKRETFHKQTTSVKAFLSERPENRIPAPSMFLLFFSWGEINIQWQVPFDELWQMS